MPDNKEFWKIIKPYNRNKYLNSNKFMMKEKNRLINDEHKLAIIMNNFCQHIRGTRYKEAQ